MDQFSYSSRSSGSSLNPLDTSPANTAAVGAIGVNTPLLNPRKIKIPSEGRVWKISRASNSSSTLPHFFLGTGPGDSALAAIRVNFDTGCPTIQWNKPCWPSLLILHLTFTADAKCCHIRIHHREEQRGEETRPVPPLPPQACCLHDSVILAFLWTKAGWVLFLSAPEVTALNGGRYSFSPNSQLLAVQNVHCLP